MTYDPECDECVEGWEATRARLVQVEDNLRHAYPVGVATTPLADDIRAALQRVKEQQAEIERLRALDDGWDEVAALRQRVEELERYAPTIEGIKRVEGEAKESRAEVARLEALILDWWAGDQKRDYDEDNPADAALYAEVARIRAQREEGR